MVTNVFIGSESVYVSIDFVSITGFIGANES